MPNVAVPTSQVSDNVAVAGQLASGATLKLIDERGMQDRDSEFGRMPRLFKNPEEIPGLTRPTQTFATGFSIDLGGNRGAIDLRFCGRGHTAGDIVGWHDKTKTLFAGDLVEAEAALYTGDAFHFDWSTGTLDAVKSFRAETWSAGEVRALVASAPPTPRSSRRASSYAE